MLKYKILVSSLLAVSALSALLGMMPGGKGTTAMLQKVFAVLTVLGALLLVYRAFR
jgi:hypothetical protein